MRLGSSETPLLPPFGLTALFIGAFGLVALYAAQRSER
jgi:hypothetical protein